MEKKTVGNLDELLAEVKKYIKKQENIDLITRAFLCAEKNHEGQFRKSGEPYLTHALQVGFILAQMRTGPKTIAAGLMHDVIEDCDMNGEDMKALFGEEIYTLVEAVTKIGNLKFTDEKEYQASNHRKIFIAMAKDVRVILIKLADRLHNMRTLQFMRVEKQKKIASETLEVYAPIAHRLGISEIKNELEDLCFMYLNNEKYHEIALLVEKRKAERDEQVQNMISEISALMDENHIQYRIFGRSKHLYSIYKKMVNKNKRFEEILDLLAIRIITDTETACYEILGYIHAKYMPIPGRFKDYIAMPKVNMYQSLHTTIIGDGGNIFEVQIRTEQMDEIAEQGVAAHWRYKENSNYNSVVQQKEIEEQLHWFKDFSLMSDDSDDAMEFMNIMQKDIFEANVYVMSPKGRVIALPNGSTPIDFAYRIHTEVGHHTVGATINGAIVPLNTKLNTGDVVDIRTSNQSSGPSEDWLKIVKSSHARNKIRSFFQKQETEKRASGVKRGEEILEEELKKRNLDATMYMDQKKIESITGSLSFSSYHDLMYAISMKNVSLQSVIERLVKHKTSTQLDNEDLVKMFNRQEGRKKAPSKSGIRVAGIDSMMITLASCCSPVPGDDIVGYVSKGQGVKVHRADCPNVANEKERLITVEWEDEIETKNYEVNLVIHSTDRSFLLSDIVTVVSQCKAGLNHVDSKVEEDRISATTKMTAVVRDADHLRMLISNLKKINSVLTVERVIK